MNFKWIGSALLCTGLAFACSGGGGGGAGTAKQAFEASINQTCSIAHECRDSFPPDQGFEFEQLFGNSTGECVTTFTEILDPDAAQASVDAGRVNYDAGDAQVCLDAAADITCDQFWGIDDTFEDPPECDTAFVGTVADGGTCTIDLDCSGADSGCDEETLTCTAF